MNVPYEMGYFKIFYPMKQKGTRYHKTCMKEEPELSFTEFFKAHMR